DRVPAGDSAWDGEVADGRGGPPAADGADGRGGERMRHPYMETVIAYLKGELQGEGKEAFESDLARSPERRAMIEENREVLELLEAATEERIIEIVHREMIARAHEAGASDIHLVPVRHLEGAEGGGVVLYFRINGQLHKVATYARQLCQPIVNRWK